MIGSVNTAIHTPPAAPPTASGKKTPAPVSNRQSSPSAGADVDTVQLSSTAQAQLSFAQQARQEAMETPAQTLKEAMGGDRQAQRLLAREAQSQAAAVHK